MIFQTAQSGDYNDVAFRAVRNSTTKTSTVTIAAGTPIILETATASANGGFAGQALTATSVVNNLYLGQLHAALPADSVGLVQTYGVDTDAVVATAGAAVGAQLIPNIGTLITVGASTAGNCGVQGGGSGALTVLVAPTGATQAATSVFIRAI
jgi:hypothetical protein